MNDFNIRITHRAQQDCNPAETIVEIGQQAAAEQSFLPLGGNDADHDTHVHGDATDMAEALAAISLDLGCANTLDDMLHAVAALRAPAVAAPLEWSATLCDGKRVNHAAAEKACAALGDGWRLPTRIELLSLVDDTRSEPAIDVARFPDTQSAAYWTATPLASDSSYAWIVLFGYGGASGCRRDYYNAFVRAVRSSSAGQ